MSAWAGMLYQATDLGENVFAYGINNSGDVVGAVCLPGRTCYDFSQPLANSRAFLYHNGSLNIIDPGPSVATGINNSGQVVGYDPTAVFLYSGGNLTPLPLPSDSYASPEGEPARINSTGDIAANVGGLDCSRFAVAPQSVIYRNGTATCIRTGYGGFVAAKGINDSGVVVGVKSDFVPFIYSGGLAMDISPFIGGSANAINNSGQVVGWGVWPGDSFIHQAFLYSNGVLTSLNALGGFTSSVANAINSPGDVVGNGDGFAFLYADRAFTNLNMLLANDTGTSLTDANGINDSRQIIASGANGHAFLLTPVAAGVPEPPNGALSIAGLILLMALAFRVKLTSAQPSGWGENR